MRRVVVFCCRAVGVVSILVFAVWWWLPELATWSRAFAFPVTVVLASWVLASWWWLVPRLVWGGHGVDVPPPVILGVEGDEPDQVEPEEAMPTGQWRLLRNPERSADSW